MDKDNKHSHGNLVHSHPHDDQYKHTHSHSPEYKKKAANRLSKAVGHLNKVKRMVETDVDCAEVIVQLLAVIAALQSTSKFILKEHMSHCIVDSVKDGDIESIEELNRIIDSFL